MQGNDTSERVHSWRLDGRGRRALTTAAFVSPLVVFLIVYGGSVGRGFISDDFGWVVQSRVSSARQAVALFGGNHGFYRPLVALSFAANHALFGKDPRGYGVTNLALALACGALLFVLLRALGLSRGAAAFGAGVWLLNFHGINMALLWISGRSALLLVIGALASVIGVLRGRTTLALAGFAWALFSKEEALGLTLIFASAHWLQLASPSPSRARLVVFSAICALMLVVYGLLRASSGAMTPATAPYYYQFTFAPASVARNALEYEDRAGSFAAGVCAITWITLRPARVHLNRRVMAFGCLWLAAGFALTIWLPVRSSLYACFPAVGAALMAAEFCGACWRGARSGRREWALACVVVVPLLCIPVYVARNHRWTDLADLSSRVTRDLGSHTAELRRRPWLVLIDDRSHRANIQSAFGGLIADAVLLETGVTVQVWVEPPLGDAELAGMTPPCAGCEVVRLELRNGVLEVAR